MTLPLRRMPAAALVCVAWSAVAPAQGPGQFAPVERTVTQASVSQAMGRCVLKRNRAKAIAAITAADTAVSQAAWNGLEADLTACLAGRPSATLSPLYLSSAIAEQLLAENDGVLLARAEKLAPVPPARVAAGETAGSAALGCAVRADPVDAVALLRAAPQTAPEAAAFRKLATTLQACVPATGEVSIRPYVVRATVAIETFQAVYARGGRVTGVNGVRGGRAFRSDHLGSGGDRARATEVVA